jgi:hypothetical protein
MLKSIGGKVVEKDQKLKVLKTISTINGTLYEGDTVRFQRKEDGHYRVKDAMGRIWFVKHTNVKKLK